MGQEFCKKEGCKNKALSLNEYCFKHISDIHAYIKVLEDYNKRKMSMEGFNLKGLIAPNINFIGSNLSGADLNYSNLSGADFSASKLCNCDFVGANLSKVNFTGADCSFAHFMQADLSYVRALNTNFIQANLSEANLLNVNFLNAKLYKSNLYHASLDNARFLTKENFSFQINKFILKEGVEERGVRAAKESYINLKKYFLISARYDDLSWASFKENSMETKRLLEDKQISFFPLWLMGLLCGWGERPLRAVIASLVIILGFAVIYFFNNSVAYNGFDAAVINYKMAFFDYIYYSTITFTTAGYGDFIPKANIFYRFLAGSEAFIGIFMMGLFIFTLGRRFSSR
ncbi:MAG: pentapeptide repeat-containing protein [Candidatus Omnitrophota bacterium]